MPNKTKKPALVDTLPDKPSDLLSVALYDLYACSQDSAYDINFNEWHKPLQKRDNTQFSNKTEPDVCQVCFAGSIMAKTLGCDSTQRVEANNVILFHKDTILKLMAVDEFRKGHINSALDIMGLKPNQKDFDISYKGRPIANNSGFKMYVDFEDVPVNSKDYIKFVAAIQGIITTLKCCGL
jgi:hypothetical protein